MSSQIRNMRVIEYIDPEDETKCQWRLQINFGSGWKNIEVVSTENWDEFLSKLEGFR